MPARATKRKNFLGFGKTTSTARLYKGYTIRGDGKTFTVDGDSFPTMYSAQKHVDKITREQLVAKKKEAAEARAEARRERIEAAKDRAAARKIGGASRKSASVMSRYKGYKLVRWADGYWTVPQIDSSTFEDKRQAKRFIDAQNPKNAKKKKNSSRFEKCVKAVEARGGARSPRGVCAAAGRRKYGAARFAAMGIAGRVAKRGNPGEHVASMTLGGATAEVFRTAGNAFKSVVKWGKQTSEKVFKGFGQAMDWARDQVQKLAIGKSKNVDPLTALSLAQQFGPKVGAAADRVRKGVAQKLPKFRSNPMDQAARMYEEFHGTPSEEVLEYIQQEHYHSVVAGLGPLISMKVRNVFGTEDVLINSPDPAEADFADVVQLCVSEDGRQLYLVGGDQNLDLAALKRRFGLTDADIRDKMLIGTIMQITYRTKKTFELGGKEEIDFFHDLDDEDAIKENGGVLPVLEFRPRNPSMEIVGGRYSIAPPAKELGNVSPGIVG